VPPNGALLLSSADHGFRLTKIQGSSNLPLDLALEVYVDRLAFIDSLFAVEGSAVQRTGIHALGGPVLLLEPPTRRFTMTARPDPNPGNASSELSRKRANRASLEMIRRQTQTVTRSRATENTNKPLGVQRFGRCIYSGTVFLNEIPCGPPPAASWGLLGVGRCEWSTKDDGCERALQATKAAVDPCPPPPVLNFPAERRVHSIPPSPTTSCSAPRSEASWPCLDECDLCSPSGTCRHTCSNLPREATM
jgi:hypothetical protein